MSEETRGQRPGLDESGIPQHLGFEPWFINCFWQAQRLSTHAERGRARTLIRPEYGSGAKQRLPPGDGIRHR